MLIKIINIWKNNIVVKEKQYSKFSGEKFFLEFLKETSDHLEKLGIFLTFHYKIRDASGPDTTGEIFEILGLYLNENSNFPVTLWKF